jgi:hypothetical protein
MTTIKQFDITPNQDILGFFEGCALNGLEDTPVHFSAALQRKHFGSVPFGKKEVVIMSEGCVEVREKICYGNLTETATIRFDLVRGIWVNDESGSEAAVDEKGRIRVA